MNDSKRLVSLFMTVGLVLAVVVGIAVWKLSSPKSSAEASYQADAVEAPAENAASDTQLSETAAETTERTVPSGAADVPNSESSSSGTRTRGHEQARDPLLPPNAVFGSTPRTAKPTQVYRPSNVVPTSVAAPQNPESRSQTQPGGSAIDGATASQTPAPETTSAQPTESTPNSADPTEPQNGEAGSTTPKTTAAQEQSAETTVQTQGSQQPEASAQPSSPTSAVQQTTTAAPETAQQTGTAPTQQQTEPTEPAEPTPWWDRVRGFFN